MCGLSVDVVLSLDVEDGFRKGDVYFVLFSFHNHVISIFVFFLGLVHARGSDTLPPKVLLPISI